MTLLCNALITYLKVNLSKLFQVNLRQAFSFYVFCIRQKCFLSDLTKKVLGRNCHPEEEASD